MTQNSSDVEIANQGFAAFRQDLNDVLEDITTLHSGTAAPSTTYANQWWYETDTNKLYIRNEDNDAWIEILTLDQANDHLATIGASITLDGTGNVSIDSGDFTVDTNTLHVDSANNRVGIGTSSPLEKLHIVSPDTDILLDTFGDAVLIYTRYADGTEGAPTVVDDDEVLMTILAQGYDGSSYRSASSIDFEIDGTPSSGDMPGRITFNTTPDGSTSLAERMRVDNSGNVLVAHTGSIFNNINSTSTVGTSYSANGEIFACSSQSSGVMILNRKSTNGDIASFRKDGTTVGSIGTIEGDIYVGTGDTGLLFNDANNQIRPYNSTAQNSIDNAIDIGRSASRFKDLYLGGGVYLGGTGSANKLDDYEEGSFNPTLTPASGSFTMSSINDGFYTKVGQLVTFTLRIATSGSSSPSGAVTVTGLPFTSWNISNHRSGCSIGEAYRQNALIDNIRAYVAEGTSTIVLSKHNNNSGSFVELNVTDLDTGGTNRNIFVITGHYITA